jgi:hypothetical protein
MATRKKPIMMSSDAANAMLSISHATHHLPAGCPCKVRDTDAIKELERIGMIERVHVGAGVGAIPTALGKKFVADALRHLSN